MQEIVANDSASGPEDAELEEAENDEAAAEEPTPSNAEMRSILTDCELGWNVEAPNKCRHFRHLTAMFGATLPDFTKANDAGCAFVNMLL